VSHHILLHPARRVWRRGLALASMAVLVLGGVGPIQSAAAAPARAATSSAAYLALGDSVSFGYREPNTSPPPNYSKPGTFVGYPEDVAVALGLRVANAACPGETSVSFIALGVPSNGCENSPGGGPGYRTLFPLHVSYPSTQLEYALGFLSMHPDTRLVTLMIGANDAFLCQETTPDHCTSELPSVLDQISTDVAGILSAIRNLAGYHGRIVMVTYYSLDYANPLDNLESLALNAAMDRLVARYGAIIADGYGAFKTAAAHSGGDTCKAGLLTQLTTGGCGIHPSFAGQAVLALAVERAIRNS
jgi:lysophospholipase L1-like esterase